MVSTPKLPPQTVRTILKILKNAYPEVKTQLHYRTPFELLVATVLSAQCTDRQVNQVTGPLFQKLATPRDFAGVSLEILQGLIRSTGFYRNKARNLKNCAAALLERHGGKVPQTLEALVHLPGVGRKTANVVLGAAFGVPGMVVDTHVARIAARLGLTEAGAPEKIERDLMGVIPISEWNDFSLRLIGLGRAYCRARRPRCPACPLQKHCNYYLLQKEAESAGGKK